MFKYYIYVGKLTKLINTFCFGNVDWGKFFISFLILLSGYNTGFATDYYWVGGTGEWSDVSRWRLTSGGTISAGVIPTSRDNVFFDANSGTGLYSVTVNNQSLCNNITVISSTPSFSGQKLDIYGSSSWETGMVYNVSITYYQATGVARIPCRRICKNKSCLVKSTKHFRGAFNL